MGSEMNAEFSDYSALFNEYVRICNEALETNQ